MRMRRRPGYQPKPMIKQPAPGMGTCTNCHNYDGFVHRPVASPFGSPVVFFLCTHCAGKHLRTGLLPLATPTPQEAA